jgi:high-affinity Fe2+/Pb2+ permease
MNNTDLMMLLKRVNQNNTQRKCIYVMGGIIIAACLGLYIVSNKNKKMAADLNTQNELKKGLAIKTQQQHDVLLQKEEHIKKLVYENQALQRALVEKQTQSST